MFDAFAVTDFAREAWTLKFPKDGEWLELGVGISLMGDKYLGNKVYVRRAYRKLLEEIERQRVRGSPYIVINGNPGLGKSFFGIFVLIRQVSCLTSFRLLVCVDIWKRLIAVCMFCCTQPFCV
jgi:hypothetical protein